MFNRDQSLSLEIVLLGATHVPRLLLNHEDGVVASVYQIHSLVEEEFIALLHSLLQTGLSNTPMVISFPDMLQEPWLFHPLPSEGSHQRVVQSEIVSFERSHVGTNPGSSLANKVHFSGVGLP